MLKIDACVAAKHKIIFSMFYKQEVRLEPVFRSSFEIGSSFEEGICQTGFMLEGFSWLDVVRYLYV